MNFSQVFKLFYKVKKFNKSQTRSITAVTDYPIPTVCPAVIKDKFKKHNIAFTDGFTCFRLSECHMCLPVKKKGAGPSEVFINKQTGHFVCEMCKCSGPWGVFERLVIRQSREGEKHVKELQMIRDGCSSYYEKGQQSWKKIIEENTALHLLSTHKLSDVFKNFNFKECSLQIIEKLNIYISNDLNIMFIPLLSSTQLVLGYIKVEVDRKISVVPKQNCAGFLVYAAKKKPNSGVIVSNLQDFFSLVAVHTGPSHIICLPYGTANLPQTALPFLENYKSLTLWLGSVPCAWDATRSFAKKLGEKRCLVIRSSEEQFTPTEAINKNSDLSKHLEKAQPTWHQAITTFSSLRNDVLQELRNYEEVLGVTWKRYPTLNKILRGHRRGELTVLTGPTGSGKTTFMSEYSLDLALQGVNTLWGSFEVRNVRLAKTMLQQYIGKPLETNLDNFEVWADDFERLPIYFLTFHGQQSVRHVMEAVQYSAYVHDIGHVIIDNVQFMIGMSDDKYQDRFYKQDLIIHAFRTFATRANCHVTLVIHPRKERDTEELTTTSIFGGAKAAQEADNVLIIQDKRLTTVKGRKYLQVAKNRHTGDLGIMLLDFNKDSLSYSQKKKKPENELKVNE